MKMLHDKETEKVYTYASLFSILRKYKEVTMNRRIAKNEYSAVAEPPNLLE